MSTTALASLLSTIERLRSPSGCPWDRAQTHLSLIPYLAEESAEVIEAIVVGDSQHLKEELGDLLLQIVLHAQIATEAQQFNFDDVVTTLTEKMIRRHPHVFSDVVYADSTAQQADWVRIKADERADRATPSWLAAIPASLSGLTTAVNLQQQAAKVGFDWDDVSLPLAKVEEEFNEFRAELADNDFERLESEFGDILFALGNVARHLNIDPERALARTNHKFRTRFHYIETHLNKPLNAATLDEMDALWEQAKTPHTTG